LSAWQALAMISHHRNTGKQCAAGLHFAQLRVTAETKAQLAIW
jgi:hypothetical protein